MIKVRKNLTGKIYGRLKVIKQADDYCSPCGQKKTMWLCQCECGNYCTVIGNNLQKGTTTSCGCYATQLLKENSYHNQISKKYNIYNLSGDYGIGYTFNGEKFYFDLEDYDLIKRFCWYNDGKGYLRARVPLTNQTIMLHDLIMNKEKCIDHINHNTFDNRKCNLRKVNTSQNAMNRRLPKNNTSGYKGIQIKNGKFKVYITVNNIVHRLGVFSDINEAIKIRKQAEEKYFGEYSYDNSMKMSKYNSR